MMSRIFSPLKGRRGAANVPLIIGGVVVAALVAVGIWFATGGAGVQTAPKVTTEPAMSPQQEAASQAAGESKLGGTSSSTGDTGGQ